MLDAVQIKLLLRLSGLISLFFTLPWAMGSALEIGSFVIMMMKSAGPTGFFLPELMPETTFRWMVQAPGSIILIGIYSISLASLPLIGSLWLLHATPRLVGKLVTNGAEHAS